MQRIYQRRGGMVSALIMLLLIAGALTASADTVTGLVTGALGPIAEARVRVQGQADPHFVTTGADGRFSLDVGSGGGDIIVTAGHPNYVNEHVVTTGGADVELELEFMGWLDHFSYGSIDPAPTSGEPYRCSGCHIEQYYEKWLNSVMATSVENPYVFSYYLGTDINGDPAGYSYRVEHPETYGDCANCHAPGMASMTTDPEGNLRNLENAPTPPHGLHQLRLVPQGDLGRTEWAAGGDPAEIPHAPAPGLCSPGRGRSDDRSAGRRELRVDGPLLFDGDGGQHPLRHIATWMTMNWAFPARRHTGSG